MSPGQGIYPGPRTGRSWPIRGAGRPRTGHPRRPTSRSRHRWVRARQPDQPRRAGDPRLLVPELVTGCHADRVSGWSGHRSGHRGHRCGARTRGTPHDPAVGLAAQGRRLTKTGAPSRSSAPSRTPRTSWSWQTRTRQTPRSFGTTPRTTSCTRGPRMAPSSRGIASTPMVLIPPTRSSLSTASGAAENVVYPMDGTVSSSKLAQLAAPRSLQPRRAARRARHGPYRSRPKSNRAAALVR